MLLSGAAALQVLQFPFLAGNPGIDAILAPMKKRDEFNDTGEG